ncbi:ATP-binding cassette domain-containing protein [Marispirochaeta sp.]|uniref:ATP-binding cassette domain-containing protein n=1 Tax=Marispirochaeta sp. TaxID=2038653 RepID=UPI0029C6FBF3|nr:ATP-binding cassette domain-containing protein [Marispirochaeta sp.]
MIYFEAMKQDDLLVSVRNIVLTAAAGGEHSFPDCDIRFGRCTVLYGPNGSGKTWYSRLLAGEVIPFGGTRDAAPELNARTESVSFETGLYLLEAEKRRDESDLNGGAPDLGRPVGEYLGIRGNLPRQYHGLMQRFRLNSLLNRGLRALSSGELRKVLIMHALIDEPLLLILDDPFDGLDIEARKELTDLLEHLLAQCALVIITGRRREAPEYTDQLIELSAALTDKKFDKADLPGNEKAGLWEKIRRRRENGMEKEKERTKGRPLLDMRQINVSYRNEVILRDVNWKVLSGEAWKISGPNGAGKTTLMELVNGDNPKAYGQELYLFGRRKGTGESVWEIKKQIGHVSAALHMRQLMGIPVMSVVLSGFFDTLGLYDRPKDIQIDEAREWSRLFGIDDVLTKPMRQVSFGIQRVALIVRALIKRPELLLLDEPCHGLDDHNTSMVLQAAQLIAKNEIATLLYVSHDPDHHVPAITHHLLLKPHEKGGYTAEVQKL